jgi:hypothetical protein
MQNFMPTDTPQKDNSVKCSTCGECCKSFRFMMSVRSQVIKEHALGDEADQISWTHTCAQCLAVSSGSTLADAVKSITDQRVRHETSRTRAFKAAKDSIVEHFSFVQDNILGENPSQRAVKRLCRTNFVRMFAPMAGLINIKISCMETAHRLTLEYHELTTKVRGLIAAGANATAINEALGQVDELESKIAEASQAIAFRSKGDQQGAYLAVVEFADEWLNWGGYRLRSYYSCVCGAVISSKYWPRLHEDVNASGQRYYCPAAGCNRRYRPKFGQLVELLLPNQKDAMWSRTWMTTSKSCVCASMSSQSHGAVRSQPPALGGRVIRVWSGSR